MRDMVIPLRAYNELFLNSWTFFSFVAGENVGSSRGGGGGREGRKNNDQNTLQFQVVVAPTW